MKVYIAVPQKAQLPTYSRFESLGNTIFSKRLQKLNALAEIRITVFGIRIC